MKKINSVKPKIAIIGANESIDILIKKAKEKGYETHVFAWKCNDPGEKSADFFYPINVADKEKILDVCRSLNICGVASITSDFAVNTVNYVARNLGLVCNGEYTDSVARNKYLMRCAFMQAGIFTPWFMKVGKDCDLSSMCNHEYPVIVKPTDRWSSKGVTRADSFEELKEAVDYAIEESLTNEAIIEDFMDGPEYSAECICQNGVCHILAITEKTTTGFPHYVETGHTEPAIIPENLQNYLFEVIKNAVKSLEIFNSAAHVEFRIIDNKEIGIIEIGARMGGDFIGTDLVRLSTGYDYVGMVIDVACNKKLEFNKGKHYDRANVKFIMSESDIIEYEKIITYDKVTIERANVKNVCFDHAVLNSSDRYGYYILTITA